MKARRQVSMSTRPAADCSSMEPKATHGGVRKHSLIALAVLLLSAWCVLRGAPSAHSSRVPLVTFGVVADAQYADAEPAISAFGIKRHYRESLAMLAEAGTHFADRLHAFVVHLGDLVDGRAAKVDSGVDAQMDAALKQLLPASSKRYHVLGNHEFYVGLSRSQLLYKYGIIPDARATNSTDHSYFTVRPAAGVRAIFLDTFDISILGRNRSDARAAAAHQLLLRHNPLYNASGGASSGNDPSGLRGLERSWVALNGGLGDAQLSWLADQLADARAAGDRVLIFSHIALHPGAQSLLCGGMCVVWNHEQVLDVLRPYGDNVAACFAGHDHSGGYARDAQSGLSFITVQGIIETKPKGHAYADVTLFPDRLVVEGYGRVTSRKLRLKPLRV